MRNREKRKENRRKTANVESISYCFFIINDCWPPQYLDNFFFFFFQFQQRQCYLISNIYTHTHRNTNKNIIFQIQSSLTYCLLFYLTSTLLPFSPRQPLYSNSKKKIGKKKRKKHTMKKKKKQKLTRNSYGTKKNFNNIKVKQIIKILKKKALKITDNFLTETDKKMFLYNSPLSSPIRQHSHHYVCLRFQ